MPRTYTNEHSDVLPATGGAVAPLPDLDELVAVLHAGRESKGRAGSPHPPGCSRCPALR